MSTTKRCLVVGMLALVACADLDRVDLGICGNRVTEADADEDCDTFDVDGFACEACRLQCNGDACPAGYACGVDGICRQPTGAFEPRAPQAIEPVASWATLDVDADGRDDLLVTHDDEDIARIEIRAFDDFADPLGVHREPTTVKASVPLIAGALGTGDDPALLVAHNPRAVSLSALRGRASGDDVLLPNLTGQFRGIQPTARLAPAVALGDRDEYMALVEPGQLSALSFGVLSDENAPRYLLEAPLLTRIDAGFVGEVEDVPAMVAMQLGSDIFAVEALVLAYPGASTLHVVRGPPSDAGTLTVTLVDLPEGVMIDGGVWAGDVNDDDVLDLLVGARGDTYVAYGSPVGVFSSRSDVATVDDRVDPIPYIQGAQPLAVADIDEDGYADFALPNHGIALSEPPGSSPVVGTCPVINGEKRYGCGLHETLIDSQVELAAPSWSEAIIADINGDDRLDVVGAVAGDPELDVLFSSPDGFMRRFLIEATGVPQHLRAGDFNDDFFADVAYDTRPDDGAAQGIQISYGRASDGPAPAVTVFEAEIVHDIRPASSGRELAFLWATEAGAPLNLSSAVGRSDQILAAELIMPIPIRLEEEGTAIPQRFALGRFDDAPGNDAALLYRDLYQPQNTPETHRVVIVPAGSNGALLGVLDEPVEHACKMTLLSCASALDALHPVGLDLDAESLEQDADWSAGLVVVADLDGEGSRDELILLAPARSGDGTVVVVAHSDGERFAVAQELFEPMHPLQAEVSHEGGLVLLAATDAGLSVFSLPAGDGVLTETAPVRLSAPIQPTSFAVYDGDLDGAHDEYAFASPDGVHVGTLFGGAIALVRVESRPAERVIAGDVDGDGLPDLAALIEGELVILRGEAKIR